MTFTPPDVASLSSALSHWELAEYICAGFVTVACAGEYVADFTNWLTNGKKERKERLAKIATLLLITALAFELICLVRTNNLSGRLIGSLDEKAGEAATKAQQALGDSSLAIIQSGKAVDTSGEAKTSASNALVLAHSARTEADSFEKDIVSAKKQAAEAEAHLAEVVQRAANAEHEADRLTRAAMPRRLSEDQKAELVRLLSATPTLTVVFEPIRSSTIEVLDFTDDFIDVFMRMKLLAEGTSSRKLDRAIAAAQGRGVIIGVMRREQHPPAADVLISTLRQWGFEASGEAAPDIVKSATELRVLVGAKQ